MKRRSSKFPGLLGITALAMGAWWLARKAQAAGGDIVTPDVEQAQNSTVQNNWFGGGASFPAGNYTVQYQGGAFSDAWGFFMVNWIPGVIGYSIAFDDGASIVPLPETTLQNSPAEAESAAREALAGGIQFAHAGGKIGIQFVDFVNAERVAGTPNPSFRLLKS